LPALSGRRWTREQCPRCRRPENLGAISCQINEIARPNIIRVLELAFWIVERGEPQLRT
jgi:hypothetical protein